MKLLGIDFGLSKIGLAIAEENLARPLGVIHHPAKSISRIVRICREDQIEKIVLGLPEGKLREKVEKFARELSQASALPIEFQDENLTTKEAIVKMIEVGKKKQKRQKLKDAFAAACILQEYLKKRRENV